MGAMRDNNTLYPFISSPQSHAMLLVFILPEVVNKDGQVNQSAFLSTLYMSVAFSVERRLTHE